MYIGIEKQGVRINEIHPQFSTLFSREFNFFPKTVNLSKLYEISYYWRLFLFIIDHFQLLVKKHNGLPSVILDIVFHNY